MTSLTGIRVLLVEDEGAIAMLIEEMLEDMECTVVASVAQLAKALQVATVVEADLAILDVNLAGERVFPVARVLRARNIPFLFSTGYGVSGLPGEFADCPVLHKPFAEVDLRLKVALTLEYQAVKPATDRPV
ncbi:MULTISPECIES: response regulator [Pseudomonas]|uniref:Response regulator n=1 Tax=Pseudomonas azadiae TaxID=2843612 RepID=A0ABS6P5E5_9PSED|nr:MULTISPECIES: response regulator [Pseudomonas]MBV4455698.1 response regulator [Pseudomonas azadiae]NMF43847.1 response regulator [Pseudomonas sp. SWRI 103]